MLLRSRRRRRGQAKKLADAARHWAATLTGRRRPAAANARAAGDTAGEDEDLSIFGITLVETEAETEAGAEEEIDERFPIWPEHADVVTVFLAMRSQWNRSFGMAGQAWLGLRYEAIETVLRLTRITPGAGFLADLQTMEYAALEVLNKREQ